MSAPREHVPTRLRLSRDTLALIDETVAKAREEFDDPQIDRQQVLELLLEHRIETLKRDGGLPDRRGVRRGPLRWPVERYDEFRRLGLEIDS